MISFGSAQQALCRTTSRPACQFSGVFLANAGHYQDKYSAVLDMMNTIDHHTLQRLVSAGAAVGAEVYGRAGGWEVVINYGLTKQPLVATRGKPRKFRNFTTLATYLRALSIVEFKVNSAEFDPEAKDDNDPRRVVAAERLKAAHAAADYDKWFRAEVQASIDDPRLSLSAEDARKQMAGQRDELRKRIKAGTH